MKRRIPYEMLYTFDDPDVLSRIIAAYQAIDATQGEFNPPLDMAKDLTIFVDGKHYVFA